jgi:hypothetical protein
VGERIVANTAVLSKDEADAARRKADRARLRTIAEHRWHDGEKVASLDEKSRMHASFPLTSALALVGAFKELGWQIEQAALDLAAAQKVVEVELADGDVYYDPAAHWEAVVKKAAEELKLSAEDVQLAIGRLTQWGSLRVGKKAVWRALPRTPTPSAPA